MSKLNRGEVWLDVKVKFLRAGVFDAQNLVTIPEIESCCAGPAASELGRWAAEVKQESLDARKNRKRENVSRRKVQLS